MVFLLFGKFAFDVRTFALACRIGLAENLGARTVFLHDDAGALAAVFELLMVGVGIVSLVRRHLLELQAGKSFTGQVQIGQLFDLPIRQVVEKLQEYYLE